MARRSQHSFLKRQKEIKRKDKAAEKTARRQGKERPSGPKEPESGRAGGTQEADETDEVKP